jgi:hypothetical protein
VLGEVSCSSTVHMLYSSQLNSPIFLYYSSLPFPSNPLLFNSFQYVDTAFLNLFIYVSILKNVFNLVYLNIRSMKSYCEYVFHTNEIHILL